MGHVPSSRALVKIGLPAVDVILRSYVPMENNTLRCHLMCEVLQDVLGKDLGVFVLKQRLEKEADPEKNASLKATLRELEK